MKRKRFIIVASFLILLCASGIWLIIEGGPGVKTTQKTFFQGIRSSGRAIEFKNVRLKSLFIGIITNNVWFQPKKRGLIQVKIDSKLSKSVISVTPTFYSRFLKENYVYKAKEIIIWTSTDENQVIWQRWIKEAEEAYFSGQDKFWFPLQSKKKPLQNKPSPLPKKRFPLSPLPKKYRNRFT